MQHKRLHWHYSRLFLSCFSEINGSCFQMAATYFYELRLLCHDWLKSGFRGCLANHEKIFENWHIRSVSDDWICFTNYFAHTYPTFGSQQPFKTAPIRRINCITIIVPQFVKCIKKSHYVAMAEQNWSVLDAILYLKSRVPFIVTTSSRTKFPSVSPIPGAVMLGWMCTRNCL